MFLSVEFKCFLIFTTFTEIYPVITCIGKGYMQGIINSNFDEITSPSPLHTWLPYTWLLHDIFRSQTKLIKK